MQLLEFDAQMDRLRITYGEKYFPRDGEREKALWDRVKSFPVQQLADGLTSVIGDNYNPPSVQKIAEATISARKSVTYILPPVVAFECDPCRDFGYGWDGDTIVACQTCSKGRTISPQELAKQQANYDRGRKQFPTPASLLAFLEGR